MALKTSEEYVERLKRMKPTVYAHGRKIRRDDPILKLPINTLRFTFDAVGDLPAKIHIFQYRPIPGWRKYLS